MFRVELFIRRADTRLSVDMRSNVDNDMEFRCICSFICLFAFAFAGWVDVRRNNIGAVNVLQCLVSHDILFM